MSKPTKLKRPGLYDGIPLDHYHGDLCAGPSLSESGGVELLETCPAKFWHGSYLNPERARDDRRQFNVGSAAHLLFMPPREWAAHIVEIDADSYRGDEARRRRDRAYRDGKVPLLEWESRAIIGMHDALMAHPQATKAFKGGRPERTLVARDPQTGVWLKARPDYMPDEARYIVDYKTARSAHPRMFRRQVYDLGYYIQAPWYLDVARLALGREPDEFWFVVQETKPPYLFSINKLDERAIEWGRIMSRGAINLFARCIERNEWPGYARTASVIALPPWAEFQLEDRRESGEFSLPPPLRKASRKMLDAAMKAQAPLTEPEPLEDPSDDDKNDKGVL